MPEKIYCVGNAHLDPVWRWSWQEGSCEAKATIRSALDRMKEYPEFVFVCSASRVFEWIEEFDPEMFEEIRERVKEGRFVLVGGWYVQADCNNASGEGYARQALYAQRYFMEKFGVTAVTGYNVDSFGHNGMLPQILLKSGLKQYVFLRPSHNEKDLPSHIFRWRSPDGSEVLTSRIPRNYNTSLGMQTQELFDELLDLTLSLNDPALEEKLFFYGVGNHGGGPTKRNIELIMEARERYPEKEFHFSDLNDYFDSAREHYDSLPVVEDDMQHHASGCYSTETLIKNGIRRTECELGAAENFAMLGYGLGVKPLPDTKVMAQAWKNVLFAHFHDSMGGCCVRYVYDDIDRTLGESRTIAARVTNNSLQTVSWKIDTTDESYGLPLIVFNPLPFPVKRPIRIESYREEVRDKNGNRIPCQKIHSEVAFCRALSTDTLIMTELPALGYQTYYIRTRETEPAEYQSGVYAGPVRPESGRELFSGLDSPVAYIHTLANQNLKIWQDDTLMMENDRYEMYFEKHTGYIRSILDKKTGRQLLKGFGAVPVVIDEFGRDTWSHTFNYFDREAGFFGSAETKVMESGPVRARVKVTSHFGKSTLVQNIMLTAGEEPPYVEAIVDWHEEHKMLKLRFDTAIEDAEAFYEIPFGVMKRPANGEEEPGLMWIAARGRDAADGKPASFAIMNDCKYSFSVKEGSMNLTVLRSPYYIDHGRSDRTDTEVEFMEQGEHRFRYAFMPLDPSEDWHEVTKRAKSLNIAPVQIVENHHKGILPLTAEGLTAPENIIISAFKRSEDGTGTVLRAYETDGKRTAAVIGGPLLPVKLEAEFGPYCVNTYYLKDGSDCWKEVLMTEFDK